MSKGTAAHIIITLLFVLSYWWITDGTETSAEQRTIVVILFFLVHGFAVGPISDFGGENNLYKKKL